MGRGSSYGNHTDWDDTLSVARGLAKAVAAQSLRTQYRHNAVRRQEESILVELEEQVEEQIEEQIEEPVLPPIEEPVATVLGSEEASFFGPRCNHAHTVQNTFCHCCCLVMCCCYLVMLENTFWR
jgi:hypothetical protein